MNTKIIAIVVAIIILLGAGGIFLYSQKQNPTTKSSTNPTPTKAEQAISPTSLLDLLASGKTQSCTFSDKRDDGSSTEGTIYLTGTKMRGDITNITKDKKTSMVYMIRDGDTTYIWGTDLPQGIKMTLSANDLKTNTQANQYVNTTAKYKCSGWTLDSSKFVVPTNIKFTDVSSIMPKTTGTTTQTGPGYSCAGITDPTAKAACENSLQQSGQ